MVKRLTPNPAAIRATDGIGVLAGPTGNRSPMRDGTDGDKYKPLDSARLLSEVHDQLQRDFLVAEVGRGGMPELVRSPAVLREP